jgi:predicted nucleic acid-binding protein
LITYFDTSAIVPLLVDEPTSSACERFWNGATRVVTARVMYAEARAALAMARRLDRLDSRRSRQAISELDVLTDEIDHVELDHRLVHEAGELAERRSLKGYDAIHLAAALTVADADLVMVSNDRRLTEAASALGLNVGRLTDS